MSVPSEKMVQSALDLCICHCKNLIGQNSLPDSLSIRKLAFFPEGWDLHNRGIKQLAPFIFYAIDCLYVLHLWF